MYTYTHTCIYVYIYACIHVFMYTCMYTVHVCMYICMHTCMYICIHRCFVTCVFMTWAMLSWQVAYRVCFFCAYFRLCELRQSCFSTECNSSNEWISGWSEKTEGSAETTESRLEALLVSDHSMCPLCQAAMMNHYYCMVVVRMAIFTQSIVDEMMMMIS